MPWQDAGTTSTVHLVSLAPGDYSFKVRTVTPDGLPGKPGGTRLCNPPTVLADMVVSTRLRGRHRGACLLDAYPAAPASTRHRARAQPHRHGLA